LRTRGGSEVQETGIQQQDFSLQNATVLPLNDARANAVTLRRYRLDAFLLRSKQRCLNVCMGRDPQRRKQRAARRVQDLIILSSLPETIRAPSARTRPSIQGWYVPRMGGADWRQSSSRYFRVGRRPKTTESPRHARLRIRVARLSWPFVRSITPSLHRRPERRLGNKVLTDVSGRVGGDAAPPANDVADPSRHADRLPEGVRRYAQRLHISSSEDFAGKRSQAGHAALLQWRRTTSTRSAPRSVPV
jgi:hypothetical protein